MMMPTRRVLLLAVLLSAMPAFAQLPRGWKIDVSRATIPLNELLSGGPSKDGIPAIDRPRFIAAGKADWLAKKELVILLESGGEARAYPLQILMWHELVNDTIDGKPVLVSYCPLCNSAIVFDRRVKGETLQFGVSGLLRNSDMVMFDRKSETLWQQITGEALVGQYSGESLTMLPSQMIPFEEFVHIHPDGRVLSRETGFHREYGRNPYVGYEFGPGPIMPVRQPRKLPLPPMEKLVVIKHGGTYVGVPFRFLSKQGFWQGELDGENVVVLYSAEGLSPLDEDSMAASRKGGAAGVFRNDVDGKKLAFHRTPSGITDQESGSVWSVSGQATAGPLNGQRFQPVTHGVYFAFAWLAFQPDTQIVE